MPLLDAPHYVSYSLIRKASVLAALKNKRPEPKHISFIGTGQYLILCQTVSVNVAVALPDAAIVAIVLANVRKLDKPSYVYTVSKPLVSQIVSLPSEILKVTNAVLKVTGIT